MREAVFATMSSMSDGRESCVSCHVSWAYAGTACQSELQVFSPRDRECTHVDYEIVVGWAIRPESGRAVADSNGKLVFVASVGGRPWQLIHDCAHLKKSDP